MEENALKLIYKVCPRDCLMEALFYKDYETSMEVLQEYLDEASEIKDMFEIFDSLSKALEHGSEVEIINIINLCEKEYIICLAIEMVNLLNSIYESDDQYQEILYDNELLGTINYLKNYYNVTKMEKLLFAQTILSKKNKKYPSTKALKKVMSLPFCSENATSDLAKYVEGLIYGNEITIFDVWEAIIDCNPDKLLEQIEVMQYLRELYYELKKEEVNQMQQQVDKIRNMGLKRTK